MPAEVEVFDFTEDEEEFVPPEPIPFEIRYMRREFDREGKATWVTASEKFTAEGEVPGGILMRTIGSFAGMDEAQGAAGIQSFLEDVLIAQDQGRFIDLIQSTDTRISMKQLGKIVQWLLEKYETETPDEKPRVVNGKRRPAQPVGRKRPTRRA